MFYLISELFRVCVCILLLLFSSVLLFLYVTPGKVFLVNSEVRGQVRIQVYLSESGYYYVRVFFFLEIKL